MPWLTSSRRTERESDLRMALTFSPRLLDAGIDPASALVICDAYVMEFKEQFSKMNQAPLIMPIGRSSRAQDNFSAAKS